MGARALLRPLRLLPLLLTLCGRPPGAAAQSQICSVDKSIFQVEENTNVTEALVNISLPEGQHVTLGAASTPMAFRVLGNQLFLNMTPDYEEYSVLEAHLECRRGNTVVTQLRVFVTVLDVNDNAPEFPFTTKEQDVEEDTRVNSIVIPEKELQATDRDKDDILFYTLREVTPGAGSYFSLAGANQPALKLDRPLDYYRWQNATFQLLVRDTWEEQAVPSHSATATLLLKVLPADLRPPWFLPCSYSDGYVCIQAQYRGAVPTGHTLPSPLVLRPGPVYAVDGDRAISQRVIYSITGGNTNDVFKIDADTGNLTMAKSIPSPMTFVLVVKAEQADLARYSVTQVTVEARAVSGSPPSFSQSLYRGFVAPGSGPGVAVMDTDAPSQTLRIWAQDPEFPDFNSAITYRITNCSEFKMDGEAVLTATELEQAGVFYAEVEARNTVTSTTATTVVEIQVSEQVPPSTGPPSPTSSPQTGGTARPWSSTVSQGPRPPGGSDAPTTTSAGGGTGPRPPSGTTPRPAFSPTTGRPSSGGAGTSPTPATPSGGPTQTPKPEVSQPTTPKPATPSGGPTQTPKPEVSQPTTPTPATPSGGPTQTPKPEVSQPTTPKPATPSGGPTQTPKPGASQPTTPSGGATSPRPATPDGGSAPSLKPVTSLPTAPGLSSRPPPSGVPGGGGGDGLPGDGAQEGQRFSVVDMAVLGGVLGALLLLALAVLAVLIHKHYGDRLSRCSRKAKELEARGFDNRAFLEDENTWAPARSPSPGPQPAPSPADSPADSPAPARAPGPADSPADSPAPARAPGPAPSPAPPADADADSPSAVRSILTKERRPEGGYKAVWFGEDIGAEADVVVLNSPGADADADGGDSGDSGDEDEDQAEAGRGPQPQDPDSTDI